MRSAWGAVALPSLVCTQSGVGNHDILSWEFRDTFSPIVKQAPEPGILLLFGIGLLGWAAGSRRRA
jgi:hypothetical protein